MFCQLSLRSSSFPEHNLKKLHLNCSLEICNDVSIHSYAHACAHYNNWFVMHLCKKLHSGTFYGALTYLLHHNRFPHPSTSSHSRIHQCELANLFDEMKERERWTGSKAAKVIPFWLKFQFKFAEGLQRKEPGTLFFDGNRNHGINHLSMKFGIIWMTMVALVGVGSLGSLWHRAHTFGPTTPTPHIFSKLKCILFAIHFCHGCKELGSKEVNFDHLCQKFWHLIPNPSQLIFGGKWNCISDQPLSHGVYLLHLFSNDVCFLRNPKSQKNSLHLVQSLHPLSGSSGVKICLQKN